MSTNSFIGKIEELPSSSVDRLLKRYAHRALNQNVFERLFGMVFLEHIAAIDPNASDRSKATMYSRMFTLITNNRELLTKSKHYTEFLKVAKEKFVEFKIAWPGHAITTTFY